ncbi:hypothetical protein F8271_19335 [Micromonospora sp. ALFpr18c]|uniref:lantibiotic dehydratase n=1 Tax=unclassified Micromonospora TaxID=2617518 RepID=UPI00124AEFB0|nr:lantibiotic dehydratase [Micromonospora sp. ALFpr18c]KAB1937333.1 hypothetical protein F8271_19335 [Micromonospora sp. ALFpr18c]
MDVVFTCTEQFVLRAAALPRSAARGTRAAPVDVRNVVADPVAAPFAEAVGLASRSLDATFAKVAHGRDLPDRRADRAADSLTRYLLRMSGRAGDRRAAEPFTARLREHLHAFAEPESMFAVRTVPADWAGLLDGAAGVALALGGTSPGGPVLSWDGALLLS